MLRKLTIAAVAFVGITNAHAGDTIKIFTGKPGAPLAYVDGPEDSAKGILLVHDFFGISPATEAETARLAKEGYRVVAIDLYKGQSATNNDDATKLMNALDPKYAQEAVADGLMYLAKQKGRKIGILAFSMGGKIGLEAALGNGAEVSAAAAVYGGGYENLDENSLKAANPILLVSGSKDEWAYPALLAMQERMKKAGNPIETVVFPGADHGYAQPYFLDGKNVNPAAIDLTHDVVDQFFRQHLQ